MEDEKGIDCVETISRPKATVPGELGEQEGGERTRAVVGCHEKPRGVL